MHQSIEYASKYSVYIKVSRVHQSSCANCAYIINKGSQEKMLHIRA